MNKFYRELDERDMVVEARNLHEYGVRREWQNDDEYVRDETMTYTHELRPEIFRYHGEYMEEMSFFMPTLEDALAFFQQRELTPVLEYFAGREWRLTWDVGCYAEGITPRLAAVRAMVEFLRLAQEKSKDKESESKM